MKIVKSTNNYWIFVLVLEDRNAKMSKTFIFFFNSLRGQISIETVQRKTFLFELGIFKD